MVVLDHACLAPDLHPAAMGIVHHEDVGLGILGEIALRQVLLVAGIVGKSERLLVQHFQKALRTTAVLDIGLAIRRGSGEIEAVGLGEEGLEVFIDLGAPAALLDPAISLSRTLARLDRLHRGGKGDIAGIRMGWRHRTIS